MVEVDFGPNEKQFKRYELLERVEEDQDIFNLLERGLYGGPSDLRRVLIFEKIKGELTNVFYSMEASNTDFYPHQFKPVMHFIESPIGRMLIADEVGLGKTIEAIYIWKEIQARHSARRLLIVCPAMLREKWRGDLRNRFNIASEIVSASTLLERIGDVAQHKSEESFVCIASLEGLRPQADFDDTKNCDVRAELARLLDQNAANEEFALFDYVIIDEAHYLRNPSTANNRLGRLLRDAAHHMVLLTATPIQLKNEDLYQLLRLVDPDQFYDLYSFKEMIIANAHIVRAQRMLWHNPPKIDEAKAALQDAEGSDYFKKDAVLARVREHLMNKVHDPERRIEILRLLESRSLLSQFMTRSRKREVMEQRVERAPQVLRVKFTEAEAGVYEDVTNRLRDKAEGKFGASLFPLITRQRQMASSIPGALHSWQEQNLIDEMLWEDFGLPAPPGMQADNYDDSEHQEDYLAPVAMGASYDIEKLKCNDQKYDELRKFLKEQLEKNPGEKFVIFAYYRGTLNYLARRLKADSIKSALIMGGMGREKDDLIKQFSRSDGPSVLLSSEVGSEGIDLQFCRFIVNYDLPWNPMRVEQRIGRLDRLGQKAERISIINFVVDNTIEDRILLRLYERIGVFRESIGDMEGILGDETEKLIADFFDPKLTNNEREQRSEERTLAICNTQKAQKRLEEEAVNLVGFSDYILDQINDSRDNGRWLSGSELQALVEDFFALNFPGTKIKPVTNGANAAHIVLSGDARQALRNFISENRPPTRTTLHQKPHPVLCVFDPRKTGDIAPETEFVEPSHPLIQWIRNSYQIGHSQLHRVTAIRVAAKDVSVSSGDYVFSAHLWSFSGLKSEKLLAFRAIRLADGQTLGAQESEKLVSVASRVGEILPNAANILPDSPSICRAAVVCDEALDESFGDSLSNCEAENRVRCDQQRTSAEKLAKRKTAELQERINRFREEGKNRVIPMTEGRLKKEEEQLKIKLDRIAKHQHVDPTMVPLALGVIRVV